MGASIPHLIPSPPWVSLTRTLHDPGLQGQGSANTAWYPGPACTFGRKGALLAKANWPPDYWDTTSKMPSSIENALFRPIAGLSSDRATFG